MTVESKFKKLTWDEIVPRLTELSGRHVQVEFSGTFVQPRYGVCKDVSRIFMGLTVCVGLRDIVVLVQGRSVPDDLDTERYLYTSEIEVRTFENGDIEFYDGFESITFFAAKAEQ